MIPGNAGIVDKIAIPIFLAHGDKDTRVDIDQGHVMKSALESANKSFVYLEQKGGDHFLSEQKHRVEFFKKTDEFLSLHLTD